MAELPSCIFRSFRTKEINHHLKRMCDIDHPSRIEGHSLHAVVALQRHFVIAPSMSDGVLQPCHYIFIWSKQPGPNLLWNREVQRDVECNLFPCHFPSQFTGMQFIMAGAFGSAFRAIYNRGNGSAPLNVVIKRIDLSGIKGSRDSSSLILVMREKMLLQRLHHDDISSIIMQYNDPNDTDVLYFVLEDGGPSTLDNLLRHSIHTTQPLLPSQVETIVTHILRGLNFLHHNMIIHRDIKGDNICMSGFVARIIDFGMARSLIVDGPRADGGEMLQHHIRNSSEEHEQHARDEEEEEESDDGSFKATRNVSVCQRSTAQYSAPEALLSKGHYDSKVDVWAVGCLLSELLFCCDSSQLIKNSSSSSKFLARFLFRPTRPGDSSLPLILHYLVASPGDLVDAAPGGTVKALSERMWSSLVSRGFIDRDHPEGVNRGFTWVDLASKFPTPALPADEAPIFEKLRTLMLRLLTFDPDQRYSAADALNFLTGSADNPVRLADSVLQEFRTLQQMLDESGGVGPDREKCLKFIRHVDAEHPSVPSPLSLLLD